MTINDNVLDDLDQPELPNTDIVQPQTTPKTQDPVTIVVKNDLVGDTTTELSDTDMAHLVTADVSFKTIGEKMDKVDELQDIESMLLAKESISQYDAKLVKEAGVKGRIAIEEYTKTNSNTNYKYTMQVLTNETKTVKQQIAEDFSLYVKTTLLEVRKVLEKGLGICEELEAKLDLTISEYYDLIHGLEYNKNLVFPYGGDFINIATTPLTELDDRSVDPKFKRLFDYLQLLKAVGDIGVTSLPQSSYSQWYLANIEDLADLGITHDDLGVQKSLSVINTLLRSGMISKYLDTLEGLLSVKIGCIDSAQQAYADASVDGDFDIHSFILEQSVSAGDHLVEASMCDLKSLNRVVLIAGLLGQIYGELKELL